MRMSWLLIPLGFAAGVAFAIQFGINAQLRSVVGAPVLAAAIQFLIGLIGLIVAVLIARESLPGRDAIGQSPWWVWTGGLFGAFVVVAIIVLVPRIGAATALGLFIAGQMIASVMIDHLGLIRVPIHALSVPRVLGAVLIIGGVVLVQRF